MNYKLIDMAVHGDNRGKLVSLEGNKNIPFESWYEFLIKSLPMGGFFVSLK